MLENLWVIAQQVLVLFILIGVGFLCGKRKILTESSTKHMTDIVLYVVTPCVMISAFQRKFTFELLGNILIAVLSASLIFTATILLTRLIFRGKDESRSKVLSFAAIFSNCGFMSLPLQKAILGDDGWFYGSIFVAVFNVFVWTYGLVMMSGDKKQLSIKRLVFNPGIVGVLIALILFVFGIDLPEIISKPVDYLAAMNTPLPMLIIGFYLSQADFKRAFTDVGAYISMGVRLLAVPLAAMLVMWLCSVNSTILIAFIIACSAPTAALTTMFSAKYGHDTELSVSLVSATTLFSIVTMPLVVALASTLAG